MSHQDRREPLPKDYQYEPWRHVAREMELPAGWREVAKDVLDRMTVQEIKFHPDYFASTMRMDGTVETHFVLERLKCCPKCGGPSLRGDLCYGCTADHLEPSLDSLWGV